MPDPLSAGELQAIIVLIRQHCTVCKPGTLPRVVPKLEAIRDRLADTVGDTGPDEHQKPNEHQ